jgi:hypothetical protein
MEERWFAPGSVVARAGLSAHLDELAGLREFARRRTRKSIPGYGRVVTAPYLEIDPEAILIPQHLAMEIDVSVWHICDAGQVLTWCGLLLSRGSERRPISETPEDRRCETCINRFGEGVVRHPTADPRTRTQRP